MKTRIAPVLLLLAVCLTSGCLLRDENESPWHAPGVTAYIRTVDVNRYLLLDGTEAGGNGDASRSEFDLHFYHVGSTEVFGVRSGWYPDEYGHRIGLRFMDLGPVKYELVDAVPKNGTPEADYRPVAQVRGDSDDPSEGHTLLMLDHVYALYRWNAEGGNYGKILVSRIHDPIARMQIRGAYQSRQGVTDLRPSDLP